VMPPTATSAPSFYFTSELNYNINRQRCTCRCKKLVLVLCHSRTNAANYSHALIADRVILHLRKKTYGLMCTSHVEATLAIAASAGMANGPAYGEKKSLSISVMRAQSGIPSIMLASNSWPSTTSFPSRQSAVL
jgi:hypothetical protein